MVMKKNRKNGQPMMMQPQMGQPYMQPQGQPMMMQGQPMMMQAQPYPQTVMVQTQPPVSTTTVVNVQRRTGDEDLIPALLIFVLGWVCICCIWLGGFAYLKSKNPTARMLGIASLVMYGLTSVVVIIIIIVYSVAAANATNYYYNNDNYYYNNGNYNYN